MGLSGGLKGKENGVTAGLKTTMSVLQMRVGKQNGALLGEHWRRDASRQEAQLSFLGSPSNSRGSWQPPRCPDDIGVGEREQSSLGSSSTGPCTAHLHLQLQMCLIRN